MENFFNVVFGEMIVTPDEMIVIAFYPGQVTAESNFSGPE